MCVCVKYNTKKNTVFENNKERKKKGYDEKKKVNLIKRQLFCMICNAYGLFFLLSLFGYCSPSSCLMLRLWLLLFSFRCYLCCYCCCHFNIAGNK
mmetsp:Transcript_63435/g.70956  ORF Transcript_63435/g.70956 Transcript_63435/m.70956 type:complete len:95 (+) Transcript_63435:98-382(+)